MIQEVNPAQIRFEGMLWTAFGVRIFSDNVAEGQIDTLKNYVKKLKDEEIIHTEIVPAEKENQKWLWDQ